MSKKAYRVYDKSEDADYAMVLVMAASAPEARQIGWVFRDALGAEEYTDLRAQRQPWADQYAESGTIPLRAYLENGWYWCCRYCGEHVTIEDIGGVTTDDSPVCERCADKEGLTPPDWALRGRRNDADRSVQGAN